MPNFLWRWMASKWIWMKTIFVQNWKCERVELQVMQGNALLYIRRVMPWECNKWKPETSDHMGGKKSFALHRSFCNSRDKFLRNMKYKASLKNQCCVRWRICLLYYLWNYALDKDMNMEATGILFYNGYTTFHTTSFTIQKQLIKLDSTKNDLKL